RLSVAARWEGPRRRGTGKLVQGQAGELQGAQTLPRPPHSPHAACGQDRQGSAAQGGRPFMSEHVLSERRDGVAARTLNRPERLNAINDALIQALRKALSAALADSETKVIVLNGAGRAFCSGDDLEDFPAQSRTEDIARRYLEDLQDVTRLIVMGDKM